MNNTQFRRLVLDTPSRPRESDDPAASSSRPNATPMTLGSRMRSSIPMTPRNVSGSTADTFASQLAQRDADIHPDKSKTFRSSLAPKGTKLAAGYQDRTKSRMSEEEDGKASRVKALEGMLKLGQMDESTFSKLRDEIVGQNIDDVHLVKGLDFKLLQRVRRGEDVYAKNVDEDGKKEAIHTTDSSLDVDDELDRVEGQAVAPSQKESKDKHGVMAPPSLRGKKRTRDDILKDLKAARAGRSEQQSTVPVLGSRFKKLGDQTKNRIERDEKGQEVLILVDSEGRVKRKVRKPKATEQELIASGLLMPDKSVAPLGMEMSTSTASETPAQDDGDIFEGVGAEYNPLGDMGTSDGEDSDERSLESEREGSPVEAGQIGHQADGPAHHGEAPQRKRYFDEPEDAVEASTETPGTLKDPTIMAVLKRASQIQSVPAETTGSAEEDARLRRHREMLEGHDRDAEDMDLGFGGSRRGDEEDGEEGKRVKLSVWGSEERRDDTRTEGKEKRKRGPKKKKKKGDGENVADVMKVLERRKGA